jgi:hypothetical protein
MNPARKVLVSALRRPSERFCLAANLLPKKRVAMSSDNAKDQSAEIVKLREALKMLYDLLEAYAPHWYTEEHHDRAEAALRSCENDMRKN